MKDTLETFESNLKPICSIKYVLLCSPVQNCEPIKLYRFENDLFVDLLATIRISTMRKSFSSFVQRKWLEVGDSILHWHKKKGKRLIMTLFICKKCTGMYGCCTVRVSHLYCCCPFRSEWSKSFSVFFFWKIFVCHKNTNKYAYWYQWRACTSAW